MIKGTRARSTAAIFLVSILLTSQTSFVALAANKSGGDKSRTTSQTAATTASPTAAAPADPNPANGADPTSANPADPTSADGSTGAATSSDASGNGAATADSTGSSTTTPSATAPTPPPAPTDQGTPPPAPAGPQSAGQLVGQSSATTNQTASSGPSIPVWALNTTTNNWEATDATSFYWDTKANQWLSPEYYYDTQDGYYEVLAPNASIPSYMITAAGPVVAHTIFGDVLVGSSEYQLAKAMGLITGQNSLSTGVSGPLNNSIGGASTGGSSNGWMDLTSLVNLMNAVNSTSTSGNASVTGNTSGGNATSGLASAFAELINLLSSAWSWSNGSLNLFMQNVGTQNGNINLDPTTVTTGSGGAFGSSGTAGNLTVNNSTQNGIENNVNLNAQSGDASVDGNTAAGNATSGDAVAGVNIINLMNSFISSGQSFFGILNIFGNLNGDIVFPAGFLSGLLGSSTPAASTATQSDNTVASNNTTTDNIVNGLSANATSGNAGVADNTAGGNAASGSASTGQSLFNLINTNLFANNAVLVIVNVLGHWVGKIMNLSGGSSTSALLTSGASVSPGGISSGNLLGNNNTQNSIVNNVNANATSGNADVTGNGQAGNATSGNADVAENAANIIGSNLNISNWFGVLFINVFGTWNGSIDNGTPVSSSTATAGPVMPLGVVALNVPQTSTQASAASLFGGGSGQLANNQSSTTTTAIEANASNGVKLSASDIPAATAASTDSTSLLFMISAFILMIAAGLAGLERKLRRV